MELLPIVVTVLAAALSVGNVDASQPRLLEVKPVLVYADCNVRVENSNFGDGLIVVDQVNSCSRWVCDRKTKKGYIESCGDATPNHKCSDIDIYSKKCYKGMMDGIADDKFPGCCRKQIAICPGDPGYDFAKFKAEENRYARDEPYLWCARDSP